MSVAVIKMNIVGGLTNDVAELDDCLHGRFYPEEAPDTKGKLPRKGQSRERNPKPLHLCALCVLLWQFLSDLLANYIREVGPELWLIDV
jgi:hypothetical protein